MIQYATETNSREGERPSPLPESQNCDPKSQNPENLSFQFNQSAPKNEHWSFCIMPKIQPKLKSKSTPSKKKKKFR